ncbi:MAG: class I SAM-dependent methyltransferase, partial [Raoultibacter sp.]
MTRENMPQTIDTATGEAAPATLSSQRVYEIFSTIAKKYERFNALSSMGAYKLWLRGMMQQATIRPTDDVLDIAG